LDEDELELGEIQIFEEDLVGVGSRRILQYKGNSYGWA
jgi:hypothetical protein